jgi:outer membrane protein assembly factor BamA
LLLLAVAACGSTVADNHPQASRPQEIHSVALDGRNLPLATLRQVVSTHVGDTVDSAQLERDRSALQATLVARGYLEAVVDAAKVTFDSTGAAFVAFPIRTGTQFKLRTVRVTGPKANATDVVTLAPGEDASADNIERARQIIAAAVTRDGRKGDVVVQLHEDAGAGAVDVELETR